MNIEEIKENGFSLHEHENHELDIALLSLKIGLIAYFSTYEKVQRFFDFIDEDHQWIRERIQDSGYIQNYFETIFHLHHFIEVSLKEILRQKHELHASKADRDRDILIFDKLLSGDEIFPQERENLYSREFSDAKKRLKILIDHKRISNYQNMEFIKTNSDFLDNFNHLRNRIAHRGTFVLHYKALDMLIGKYTLPFINKLLDLPIYNTNDFNWKSKELFCKIDPVQEIIEECQTKKPSLRKIAFFKQLAIAAYANPLEMPRTALEFKGPTTKEVAEKRAKKELEDSDLVAVDVKICPVCGAESLVRYGDTHQDDETGFISSVSCKCCLFWLDSGLSNININGVNTEELWQLL